MLVRLAVINRRKDSLPREGLVREEAACLQIPHHRLDSTLPVQLGSAAGNNAPTTDRNEYIYNFQRARTEVSEWTCAITWSRDT